MKNHVQKKVWCKFCNNFIDYSDDVRRRNKDPAKVLAGHIGFFKCDKTFRSNLPTIESLLVLEHISNKPNAIVIGNKT